MTDPDFELPEELPGSMRALVHFDEDTEPEQTPHPPDSSEFDPRMREPFTGLVWIGYLKKTINYIGHTFVIETPGEDLRLDAGLVHKKYANTVSGEAAWAAIVLAAYLTSVDGSPLPEPVGPNDTGLADKFLWVLQNLKGSVIRALYEETLALDYEISQMLEELERTSKSVA